MIKTIIHLFTANLGTKVMALLLALITWIFIHQEVTDRSGWIEIPLKLDVPDGVIGQAEDTETNQLTSSVKVMLEGPRGQLGNIPQNITCRRKITLVNLPDPPITRLEEIKESDFNLPVSVRIYKVTPQMINVRLMKVIEKYLKIEPEKCLSGKPAKGYLVAEVRAEPSEIIVRGPKHILQNRTSIPCSPVDISDASVSFTRLGKIVEALDNLPVTTNDPFQIIVTITEELVESNLEANINIIIPPVFNYYVKIKSEQVKFKIKGPAESINNLKKSDYNLYINITDIFPDLAKVTPGNYKAEVKFYLGERAPKGIILAEKINPVEIEITEIPKPTPPPGG